MTKLIYSLSFLPVPSGSKEKLLHNSQASCGCGWWGWSAPLLSQAECVPSYSGQTLQASVGSSERTGTNYPLACHHTATPPRAVGGGVPNAMGPGRRHRNGLTIHQVSKALWGSEFICSLSDGSPLTKTFDYPELHQPMGRTFTCGSGACRAILGPWASKSPSQEKKEPQVLAQPHSLYLKP